MNMKKSFLLTLATVVFSLFFLDGCSFLSGSGDKVKDLEFTVVSEENLSEELKTILEERKENPFKKLYFSYSNVFYYYFVSFIIKRMA